MLRTGIPRRLIALVAAYGFVLQAMLAAIAAVAPTLDQVICATDTDPHGASDPKRPSMPGHEPGCMLCPLACGTAVPAPSVDTTIVRDIDAGVAVVVPITAVALAPIVRRAGLARAPPA